MPHLCGHTIFEWACCEHVISTFINISVLDTVGFLPNSLLQVPNIFVHCVLVLLCTKHVNFLINPLVLPGKWFGLHFNKKYSKL